MRERLSAQAAVDKANKSFAILTSSGATDGDKVAAANGIASMALSAGISFRVVEENTHDRQEIARLKKRKIELCEEIERATVAVERMLLHVENRPDPLKEREAIVRDKLAGKLDDGVRVIARETYFKITLQNIRRVGLGNKQPNGTTKKILSLAEEALAGADA